MSKLIMLECGVASAMFLGVHQDRSPKTRSRSKSYYGGTKEDTIKASLSSTGFFDAEFEDLPIAKKKEPELPLMLQPRGKMSCRQAEDIIRKRDVLTERIKKNPRLYGYQDYTKEQKEFARIQELAEQYEAVAKIETKKYYEPPEFGKKVKLGYTKQLDDLDAQPKKRSAKTRRQGLYQVRTASVPAEGSDSTSSDDDDSEKFQQPDFESLFESLLEDNDEISFSV